MKFYVELDEGREPFVIDCENVIDAIALLWERRADRCRNLDDIRPAYRVHIGRRRQAVRVDAWPVYWRLSSPAKAVFTSYLRHTCGRESFEQICSLILKEYPHDEPNRITCR